VLTIEAWYCSFSLNVIVAFVNLTFITCLYKSKGDLDLERSRVLGDEGRERN
jgi:hypothetical protein